METRKLQKAISKQEYTLAAKAVDPVYWIWEGDQLKRTKLNSLLMTTQQIEA